MINPELRRNGWLEITPHRLLAMPLLLGMVFLAVGALARTDARAALSWAGLTGFVLLTLVWGTRLAANAFLDEVADKTWDWQRLSILQPWEMTWGKLLGATAFAWYGGLICLGVFVVNTQTGPLAYAVETALTLVLLAVAVHATALAAAVHMARKAGQKKRNPVGMLALLVLALAAVSSGLPRLLLGASSVSQIYWYGWAIHAGHFALASAALLAVWAVVGAYRALCQALAVRTIPSVWLAFVACTTLYTAGFAAAQVGVTALQAIAWCALAWTVALTYLMLLTEPAGPVVVRRVQRKLDVGQWRRAAEEMPCWPLTLLAAFACAVGVHLLPLVDVSGFQQGRGVNPVAVVVMLARDAGLLMFFASALKPQRAVGSTLVYILVLDWILPGMLYAWGARDVAKLVLPLSAEGAGVQIFLASLQCIGVWWLAWRRIQMRLSFTRPQG